MSIRELVGRVVRQLGRTRGSANPVRISPHASSARRFAIHSKDAGRSGERPLSESERAVIRRLLERPFAGRDELIAQLTAARASKGCDCGCPTIAITVDHALPPAPVKSYLAVEAGIEVAGKPVEILLFARAGYMSALELVWYGDAPVRQWPAPQALTVINYDESTWSDGT